MQHHELKLAGVLMAIGIATGLARIFAASEKVTRRVLLARVVLSALTGLAAGSVVLMFPAAPALAQIGLACILSQLGVSALERLIPNVGQMREAVEPKERGE